MLRYFWVKFTTIFWGAVLGCLWYFFSCYIVADLKTPIEAYSVIFGFGATIGIGLTRITHYIGRKLWTPKTLGPTISKKGAIPVGHGWDL